MKLSTLKTKTNLIILSVVTILIIFLLGILGMYLWQMSTVKNQPTQTSQNISSSSSSSMTKSSVQSISSLANSQTEVNSSSAPEIQPVLATISPIVNGIQKVSCPDFEFSVNANKFQIGYSGPDETKSYDYKSQQVQTYIKESKLVRCTESTKYGRDLGEFQLLNTKLECFRTECGLPTRISFSIVNQPFETSEKIIEKKLINTFGLQAKLIQINTASNYYDNSISNFHRIEFRVGDLQYELVKFSSTASNPTETQNEELLKDIIALFNTIKPR